MKDTLIDLSKEAFVSAINESNPIAIDHTKVILTSEAIANADTLEYDKTATVTIAPAESSDYTGSQQIAIKAFDGDKLAKIVGGFIATTKEATVSSALDTLAKQRGVLIDNDTVGTISWTGDEGTLTIPNGNCFAIIGDFVLKIRLLEPLLSSAITITNVGRLHTKLPDTERTDMAVQLKSATTYGIDASKYYAYINTYSQSTVSAELASKLKNILPTTMSELANSLQGLPATVKAVADFPYANQEYTIALQVTLPDGALLLFHAKQGA